LSRNVETQRTRVAICAQKWPRFLADLRELQARGYEWDVIYLEVGVWLGDRSVDEAGGAATTPTNMFAPLTFVRRPLRPLWRPFWLRFTCVASVLVKKY
jgi:hypothetical protein